MRGDNRGVGIILIVLGLLGAVGIVLIVCGGGLGDQKAGDLRQHAGLAFAAGVVLLGLVVVGMTLSATGRQAAGRVLGVALGVSAIVFLVFVLLLTAFIYSIASCLGR